MTSAVVASTPWSSAGLWLTAAERSVMLAGLAIALGGLAGRAVSRQYKGRRPAPLPDPWAVRGSLLGLAASFALLITAIADTGLAAALSRPAPEGLHNGGTAQIALIEAAFFALAALLLRLRRIGWGALMLCCVVLAEGIRSHPEGVIPVAGAFVTYCHVFPALLWAGMLLYAIRAAIAWRGYPDAAQGIVRLYAAAAAWLFAIIVITGVISALVLVPIGSLFTTAYGLLLIAKAAVVGVAACLALAGRAWLRRHPRQGAGPALVTRLEVAALAVVLIITGVLTVATPPAKSIRTKAPAPATHLATIRQVR